LDRQDALAQARVRHKHRRPETVELVTEAKLKTRTVAFEVLTPPNPDYRQLVSAIRIPVLLVVADSGVVSLETARDLQADNSRLRVERIQEAGHGIPYDQPERLEQIVKCFLRAVVADTRQNGR
jgi:N-formylmaleamate deformylase